MATVNKDFRIKAGLVVEGANATVNGEDIITTGSTTDNLTEGTNNKYFTPQRALDATASAYDPAGSAATAQANAEDYADTAIAAAVAGLAPNYITSTTSEFSVNNGELSLDQLNGSTQINPASGLQPNNGYATIEYTDTDSGTEGLKIKSERGWVGSQIGGQLDLDAYRDVVVTSRNGNIVLNADGDTYLGSVGTGNDIATTGYVNGLASNYEVAGAAATAEQNAKSYADSLAVNYDAAGSASTAQAAAETYADGVALTAENNAKSYADSLATNYDVAGAAATALTSANSYTDTAVANLVDGAPALLDTLNELAAAIADNPNYATDVANLVAGKQDALTAGTGIDITSNTVSVDNTIATKTYVDNAVSTGVGAIDSDDVPEGTTNLYFTDQRANDAIQNTNPRFASVEVTWVRKEEATWTSVPSATATTVHTFGANVGSVKYLVRVTDGIASQISEVLVTTDASNNIAVLEYGTIYTSENELATITADWDNATSLYRLRVTTTAAAEALVAATLLSYND